MKIIDLPSDNADLIETTARLLMIGFQTFAPHAWPTLEDALEEVQESLEDDRISRIMLDEMMDPTTDRSQRTVVGWISAMAHYSGHSWELHPLVVSPSHQRRGIGRRLVADLETQVRQRGGCTIYLGSDDETGLTSIANIDLYPNPLRHLMEIQNLGGHPYGFYQKVGFTIVGVIPDANGPGKPDIFLAKRISH